MSQRGRYPLCLGGEMLPTDAFFWYAEAATPRLRPLVAGLFMLDRTPDQGRFRAAIVRLIARVPRLQQRVVESGLRIRPPQWHDDPNFDLDYHLRVVGLPGSADERHVLDFAGAVFASPLDHQRPLWEAYLIEGVQGARAALFLKMHHSVMDGEGAIALFDAMTEKRRHEAAGLPEAPPSPSRRRRAEPSSNGAPLAGVLASLLRDPLSALQSLAVAAGGVRRIVAELQAPPPDDPLSACASGVGRRLAIASVPLATLQQLRAILGVTFNDILLTIVAGAVGRYHRHRRIHLAEVGCVVPVSLREAHERRTLGNRVTATNVALPVAEPDPFARLERIRAQTTGVRANRNGSSYGVLMQALPFIPSALVRLIAGSAAGRVHLICSNVAGPPAAHFLAGAKVEGVYPFAPILLGIPLSIAVLSYAGTVCIGIDSDPAAIADPDRLAGFVGDEIAALEREVALPAHVAARGERRANRHARPSGG